MATRLLNALPTAWLCALLVALAVALAVGGLLAVRRVLPAMRLREHNEVAGFIYAVLGVIYAVLLPFVLVVVWEGFSDAEHAAMQEAETLTTLRLDAQAFPDPAPRQVAAQADAYARAAVDEEWPRMSRGGESAAARDALAALGQAVRAIEPRTGGEAAAYQLMLGHLDALAGWRTARLFEARSGVPKLLWAVLLFGGVLVVGYTYLYGVERLAAQAAMTAALAATVALVLAVILAIDHPFTGDFRVEPDDLRAFLAAGPSP